MRTLAVLRFRPLYLLACGLIVLITSCGVDDTVTGQPSQQAGDDELTPVLPAPDVSESPTTTEAETSTTATSAAESSTTNEPETTTTTTTTEPPTTEPAAIPDVPLSQVDLELDLIATLSGPVGLVSRPGSDDLFVIEQQGRIVRLPGGQADGADTTLDIRGTVSLGNEQGLLGMAFSPDGDTLYINFTDGSGDTQVARLGMSGTVADAASQEILLTVGQPQGNHNGGWLGFGPDGYLYIAMGDGGGQGDPGDHGQNPNTALGSILRIDVDTETGYEIPPDNPFLNGQTPEVFIWGIRNAWRAGFDQATGDLWIGDVGQDRFEEITVLRAADGGGNGANLGWNSVEGDESFRGAAIPDGHVGPAVAYGHANGRCSVTGGDVYRGQAITALYGTYLYGDFCTGEVFGYRVDDSVSEVRLNVPSVSQLSSFGIDNDGEVYAVSGSGGVYRIVAG